jgi:hypothetical protein
VKLGCDPDPVVELDVVKPPEVGEPEADWLGSPELEITSSALLDEGRLRAVPAGG